MDFEKRKFVGALSGKSMHLDAHAKEIHLFTYFQPTRFSAGTVDLEYRKNTRNKITVYNKNMPIFEILDPSSFRLLTGWKISADSKQNVLHSGWTEDTDVWKMEMYRGFKVPVKEVKKYITIESTGKLTEVKNIEYTLIGKSADCIMTGCIPLICPDDSKEPFYHLVLEVNEFVKLLVKKDGQVVISENISYIKDGRLLQFFLN